MQEQVQVLYSPPNTFRLDPLCPRQRAAAVCTCNRQQRAAKGHRSKALSHYIETGGPTGKACYQQNTIHTTMTSLDDAIAMAYVSGGTSQLDKDSAVQKAERMAQAKRLWATQTAPVVSPGPRASTAATEPKSLNASQNERLKALRQRHLQQARSPQPAHGPYCSWNTHTRAASAISERSSSSTHSGFSMASPDSAVSATFDGMHDSEDEALESKYRSLQQDLDDLHWVDEVKPEKPRKMSSRYYANHNNLSASEGHPDNLVRFTAKGIMWIGPETDEMEPTGSAQSHRGTPSISSAASTASTQSVNSLYTVQDVSYMYAEERVQIRQQNEFEWVDLLEGGFCGEKAGRPVMKRMVW
ncbi:hypothetical protein B0I72DRAFT_166366 [Yarrowia lipolytica]|jgi:hypothetical protein|uniref:YALI0C01199p n=2 Tax=Yarrowia lipolytica TaxID=4952 RepID=Q6CDE3_YARLI|nr:YALI0C01199p [Yarrowia lipolytica CLIB122]AOW02182.1 hypothetical protein YALI1_C01675g [Yarrowia lipolytica]KAB8283597.1 hypothetical protein BKA91DRAFT_161985 [Yarrowia lipolytica]KAE8170995.1 hypothetical protein BKA90DRAFT_114983 [Yarrowia lipolytica]KAJ8052937.1 hypothetical protein LXG23DRAFT_49244 [Yarrowia lipolytica]RDW23189.1 hypothetical protein B0I71DRAFT_161329 [Yarrowia lipolytica]|eukprot:XP_501319.1 YALI0C01199p [Yarrowia lipolytica CLIB122]